MSVASPRRQLRLRWKMHLTGVCVCPRNVSRGPKASSVKSLFPAARNGNLEMKRNRDKISMSPVDSLIHCVTLFARSFRDIREKREAKTCARDGTGFVTDVVSSRVLSLAKYTSKQRPLHVCLSPVYSMFYASCYVFLCTRKNSVQLLRKAIVQLTYLPLRWMVFFNKKYLFSLEIYSW